MIEMNPMRLSKSLSLPDIASPVLRFLIGCAQNKTQHTPNTNSQ
jgi:hypothetical protein